MLAQFQNGHRGQAEAKSFFCVSYMGVGTRALGPSSTAFPDTVEVKQLGFKPAPTLDADAADNGLTCCDTMLAPSSLYFEDKEAKIQAAQGPTKTKSVPPAGLCFLRVPLVHAFLQDQQLAVFIHLPSHAILWDPKYPFEMRFTPRNKVASPPCSNQPTVWPLLAEQSSGPGALLHPVLCEVLINSSFTCR